MKNARHSKILELIGQHSIDKQEELLAHLRRSGFEVTQATVSRDIRELGLVKVATGDGHYRFYRTLRQAFRLYAFAHMHQKFDVPLRSLDG